MNAILLAVAVVATCMWLRHAPESSRSQEAAGVVLITLALVGPVAVVLF
ncbi:membrane protein [Mycobacterium phage Knocker]|nr:membrane protein [Mycobacterium phage Knocker]